MTEHTVCLSDAESRRLAETGTLLVVRPVAPQPDWLPEVRRVASDNGPLYWPIGALGQQCGAPIPLSRNPLGAPGDVLVCKEAWLTLSGRDGKEHCLYRADTPYGQAPKWHTWIPSTQMPHEYVRFRPIVREAGVMRVGDIPGKDVEAMGLDVAAKLPAFPPMGVDIDALVDMVGKQVLAAYWNRRFRKYPWEDNPWVWTAVVETPEKAARDEWAQREADKRRAMLEDMWREEQDA